MNQENCKLMLGDCLEKMQEIPDKSIDLVLTDPPYGLTQNKQDVVVDLSDLFRVGRGVILTSQQPYTTEVISQFKKHFKYDLIWNKILSSGFLNANRMPLRVHEHILVFGKVKYNPQKFRGSKSHDKGKIKEVTNRNYGKMGFVDNVGLYGNMKFPTSILTFSKPHPSVVLHRTQKPISLMEYLVKSYSDEGDIVLDPFMGSGTTGVAALKLGRKFIGIEISPEYYAIAEKRISEWKNQTRLAGGNNND